MSVIFSMTLLETALEVVSGHLISSSRHRNASMFTPYISCLPNVVADDAQAVEPVCQTSPVTVPDTLFLDPEGEIQQGVFCDIGKRVRGEALPYFFFVKVCNVLRNSAYFFTLL